MKAKTGMPLLCKKCGAVLGYRVRKHDNGCHIEILGTIAGLELIGFGRVPCVCGAAQEWMPDKQATEWALERARQKNE